MQHRLATQTTGADSAGLQQREDGAPQSLQGRLPLGATRVLAGDADPGLAQFVDIMHGDRSFGDGGGRRALLNGYGLLDDPARVHRYRRQMSSLLF